MTTSIKSAATAQSEVHDAQPSISDLSDAMGLVLCPDDPAYSASVDDASETSSVGEAELDLDEFVGQSPENPELHRSKPAFYNSGWAKALLVGGASLGVCITGATAFKLMAPDAQVAAEPEEPEAEADVASEQAALERAQAAAAQTKAQLALQTQQQQMAGAAEFAETEEAVEPKSVPPKTTKALKPAPSVTTVSAKAPPPPPAPVVRAAPSPPPAASASRPVVRPAAIAPTKITSSPIQAEEIDPMAEWQRLATLGRHGTVPPSTVSQPQFTEVAAIPDEQSVPEQTVPEPPPTLLPEPAEVTTVASVFEPAPGLGDGSGEVFQPETSDSTDLLVATKTDISKSSTAKAQPSFPAISTATESPSLLVGTAAAAQTITPILWAPEAVSAEARFVIALTDPLTNRQGVQVLPSGSQLIVQATRVDPQSGLADLMVISALIGGQEFALPSGALTIRDAAGGLLQGQAVNRNRSTSHDLWRIAAGALGQAGQLMNQPRRSSRSSIATTGGSSISETLEQGDPSYVGAALEGGFGALSEVMDARQQAAVQRLADAPQLYHLPAGQSVQVFVNQSFSL